MPLRRLVDCLTGRHAPDWPGPNPKPVLVAAHRVLVVLAVLSACRRCVPASVARLVASWLRACGMAPLHKLVSALLRALFGSKLKVLCTLLAMWGLHYYGEAALAPTLVYRQGSPFVRDVLKAVPSLTKPYAPTAWATNNHVQLALYVWTTSCPCGTWPHDRCMVCAVLCPQIYRPRRNGIGG